MYRTIQQPRTIAAFLFLWLLCSALPALSQQKRALLLFKGSEESSSTVSRVAINIEPVLKNLGYTSSFHDVDKGLPSSVNADVIVTWFNTPKIADPEAYVDWMTNQISQGRKVIVLGNFGAHTTDNQTWMTNESLNRFFYPFGLRYGAAYTGDAGVLSITKQDLPAKQPVPVNYYLMFTSVNPSNKVYLEVTRSDIAKSQSALVVKTPYGGMAQELYCNHLDLPKFVEEIVSDKRQLAATDRKLLGLYKSSEGVDARSNFLARFVAPTLFDLGFGIDYHDIDKGLPSDSRMNRYSGVISWYNTPELAKAGDYVNWLTKQLDANKRVIILGNFGAFAEDVPSKAGDVRRFLQSPEYNKFFYPFGLEFRGAWTSEKKSVKVEKSDSSVMTWLEPGHVGHYYWIRSVHPDNEEYLTVSRSDLQDGESAVVVATPKGGLALESYVLGTDPSTKQTRMHIDLKKFLGRCLTLEGKSKGVLKPNVAELKSKPALPALSNPKPGGDGVYPAGITPIKRRILAFYQSSAGETATENQVFLSSQMILEHLGFVVDYHDIDNPNLPSPQQMKDYQGLLLWLAADAVPNAKAFDKWLVQNVQEGRRLVLLGDYQIREKDSLSLVNPKNVYGSIGLYYDSLGNAPLINARPGQGFRRVAPQNPKVLTQKAEVLEYERKLDWNDKDLKGNWHLVKAVANDAEIWLSVTQASGPSDVIVHTGAGSAAIGPFAIYNKGPERKKRVEIAAEQNKNKAKAEDVGGKPWRMDPFKFYARAFEVVDTPKPDFTTLNGSRIYYSHIDGDAFHGISLIDRSSLNGEMMLKRVLKKLPLPITISYVTQDVERRLDDRYSRELEVAQEIFRLPNVEAASHTFSHPFDWEKGDLTVDSEYQLTRRAIDLEKEILHSLDFIDKLCPPDKRCRILLWSGRCNPVPEAIKLVRDKGLLNMNGGESTLDSKFPNISGLLPIYGDVGEEVQFHVSAAGDFYYTGSWTGEYDGMKNLPDFYNRTESPRRLRCLNVYYHFYLAERELGIKGLEAAYADVLKREPAPLFASEYAEILRDAYETKLGKDGQGNFWISNKGILTTVRFDSNGRFPDLAASQGVIGFNRANDDLYLHLDGSGTARITLTDTPPSQVFLHRSTHRTKNWKANKNAVTFTATGQGPTKLEIANLIPSSPYRIETDAGESTVRTDGQGRLVWQGRFDGYRKPHPVRIRKVSP